MNNIAQSVSVESDFTVCNIYHVWLVKMNGYMRIVEVFAVIFVFLYECAIAKCVGDLEILLCNLLN